MKKIIFIATADVTINSFLKETIKILSQDNKIYIITKTFPQNKKIKNVTYVNLPFERDIKPLPDFLSLFLLFKHLFLIKPDLVFTITPKAGFLGMLISYFLRTKLRVHIYTGQVWITRSGLIKKLLKFVDLLIGLCSTHCLADSNSQKKFLEISKIVTKHKITVLGNGSICGVDTNKFKPNVNYRNTIRKELKIPNDSIVLLFLGRLNKDKGILDLANSLKILCVENKELDIHLLVIGNDEGNIVKKVNFICKNIISKIHFVNFTSEPEKYMAAADIFCLPSYREGFGMAALEAGAVSLPVVISNIYGLEDAVKDGKTGLFHEAGDIQGITECLLKLIRNLNLRLKMGSEGRIRVQEQFEQKYVIKEYAHYVRAILGSLDKKNIAIVSSTQLSIQVFLQKQIIKLSNNYNISIITNINNEEIFRSNFKRQYNIIFKKIKIYRNINLVNDFICFFKIVFFLLNKKYSLVFSITPKGGFLAQTGSLFALVKKRVHWFGGQVWATREGIARKLLKMSDILMQLIATNILTECVSQKKFLENEKVVKKNKLVVLGSGSICGVNTEIFKPDQKFRSNVRDSLKIPESSLLLLFLGRLNLEKGIVDLSQAVSELIYEGNKNIHLLIVGPDEENIKELISKKYKSTIYNMHFVNFTTEPEKYMAAADIFCLPSYREGFGMAALEASSSGLPVINSNIYGLVDAVEEGVTSLSHEPKNINQIKQCITKLTNDKEMRLLMGLNGRKRAQKYFEQEFVVNKFVNYIDNLF